MPAQGGLQLVVLHCSDQRRCTLPASPCRSERDVENSCGNPKPLVPADAAADLADSLADFVAPTPAPAA